MKTKEAIKVGVIGVGAIGVIHGDVLEQSPRRSRMFLGGTADSNPLKTYPGVTHHPNHEQLLADKTINAVAICTPPNTHYGLAIEALDAGKHVLVERLPALTLDQLKEMEERAKRSGLVLFTAFHAAYSPEVQVAIQEIRGAQINRIAIKYNEDHSKDNPNKWLFDLHQSGGGGVMDSGTNTISVVRRVVPGRAMITVEQAQLSIAPGYSVETQAEVKFRVGGIPASLSMDWLHPGEEHTITFFTDRGEYTIDKTQGQVIRNGDTIFGAEKPARTGTNQMVEYGRVYWDFAGHVRRRQSLISTEELKFVQDTYRRAVLTGNST